MEEDSKDKEDETEEMMNGRMSCAIESDEKWSSPIGNQARYKENKPKGGHRFLPILIWEYLTFKTPENAVGAMQRSIEPEGLVVNLVEDMDDHKDDKDGDSLEDINDVTLSKNKHFTSCCGPEEMCLIVDGRRRAEIRLIDIEKMDILKVRRYNTKFVDH
jgi:hypothetical protein